jgi:hypothetical protein
MYHAGRLASLLLLTTILFPAAALAQASGAVPPTETPPTGPASGEQTEVSLRPPSSRWRFPLRAPTQEVKSWFAAAAMWSARLPR